jgi:hypothetical protein
LSDIVLTYGPATVQVKLPDSPSRASLQRFMRVKNPGFDPERPDSIEYVDFFNSDQNTVLTGHVPVVENWCLQNGFTSKRKGWPTFDKVVAREDVLPDTVLRDYQVSALQKCLDGTRGILEVCTGGGKSEIAIALIRSLGTPRTLYIVPTTAALDEMYERFLKRGFKPSEVGRLGGGHKDFRTVTISIINSVFSGIKKREYEVVDLLRTAEIYFSDEVHHQATAFSWQAVAAECGAHRRIGMSGTPYKDNRSRFDPLYLHHQDSWLTGYFGDTLVYIPPSELQASGQLSQCRVYTFDSGGPMIDGSLWQPVYEKGIVENATRNSRISTLCANLVDIGRRPLISVERLEHGRALQRILLDRFSVSSICSYGGGTVIVPRKFAYRFQENFEVTDIELDRDARRQWKREKGTQAPLVEEDFVNIQSDFPFKEYFLKGNLQVLIGSKIYDESLDLPLLTDLINGAGGKAQQRLRQKIGRVLRLFVDKTMATIWEPYDDCHYYLESHSKQRLDTARKEGYKIILADPYITSVRFRDSTVPRHTRFWSDKSTDCA